MGLSSEEHHCREQTPFLTLVIIMALAKQFSLQVLVLIGTMLNLLRQCTIQISTRKVPALNGISDVASVIPDRFLYSAHP